MNFSSFKKLHKRNETTINAFDKSGLQSLQKEAEKIRSCGDFVYTAQCTDCGTHHFKSFSRCKSKYCSLCNKVKSSIWTAKLYAYCRDWIAAGNYVVFLNLTIRDRDSLSEGLSILKKAWHIFTNQNKKFANIFASRFVGGFKSLEIKTGKNSGQWHPHYHCIVFKKKATYDARLLHYCWPLAVAAAGGDTDENNLKILPFRYDKALSYDENQKSLLHAVKETAKYITKFDYENETPERMEELVTTLKGVRQCNCWGNLYGMSDKVEKLADELPHESIPDFICSVCGGTSYSDSWLAKYIWEDAYIRDLHEEKIPLSSALVDKIKIQNKKLFLVPEPVPEIRQTTFDDLRDDDEYPF